MGMGTHGRRGVGAMNWRNDEEWARFCAETERQASEGVGEVMSEDKKPEWLEEEPPISEEEVRETAKRYAKVLDELFDRPIIAERDQLQAQLENVHAEMLSRTKEHITEASAWVAERKRLEAENAALKASRDEWKSLYEAERNAAAPERAALEARVAELEADCDRLREYLATETEACRQETAGRKLFAEDWREIKHRCDELEVERGEAITRIRELEARVAELESEQEELTKEAATLQWRGEELEGTVKELKARAAELEGKLVHWPATCGEGGRYIVQLMRLADAYREARVVAEADEWAIGVQDAWDKAMVALLSHAYNGGKAP